MTRRTLALSAILLVTVLLVSVRLDGRQGRGGTVSLPEGPGKASVEAYCSKCHSLGNIVSSGGYTQAGWEDLLSTMIAIPAEQRAVVVDYLAKNFPEQP